VRIKATDRRVQRTRRHLHEALLSRILEKKYESITVQEILDRADVGRSTFYTHFRDKDELLVCGFEDFKASLESTKEASAVPARPSYERIIASSSAMFEHAARYRDVHRALHGSKAEAVVGRNLHSVFVAVIGRRVELEMRRRKPRDRHISSELLTLFLVSTQIAMLNWWIETRSPMPVEAIDAAYRRLVLPVLASIFE
jgi:AcrR family transcriptional regulator